MSGTVDQMLGHVAPSDDHHLGHPGPGGIWIMGVWMDGERVPVAFSENQALEIARRITAFYGPPDAIPGPPRPETE
jgi:hypothetical protein